MNNKGQTLILFLLIMPIIVGFLGFFIDISLVNYEKSKINGIIESNLMIIVEDDIRDIEKIKNVFLKNDIFIDGIEVDNEKIIISVNIEIKSIFGKILDFDLYKLNVTYNGDYLSKKIIKQ